MSTVFVLVPAGHTVAGLHSVATPVPPPARVYPRASDRAHVLSLVRAGRDPAAVRWLRGLVLSIAGGALLGCATATTLAVGFGMFGGLPGVAIGFGLAVGAFLGGFTAAMTGTERARPELVALARHATAGCVLAQFGPFAAGDAEPRRLRSRCDELDWPHCTCD